MRLRSPWRRPTTAGESGRPGGPSADAGGPAAIDGPVPLSDLRPGDRGRLSAVRLDPAHAEHVRALGLHEACDLRLCRSSGTCIVQVLGGDGSGCRIALDRDLAREVLVTPLTRDGRPIEPA